MTPAKKARRFSILQLELSLGWEILITVGIMAVLIAAVYGFNIPNPNMILIAGLVVCSAMFGYAGGITAGVIMFLYTLYFFSTDNSFFHFTPQNLQKVIVSLIGIVADMLFVCELKRYEKQAFREIRKLTEELSEDNGKLQLASSIDALTGIRNRYALRNDYNSYLREHVYVLMLDIDNFKLINDTHGHDIGDAILAQTGRRLTELFGRERCYRYGGDEFLVIKPDISEQSFKEKLERLQSDKPQIRKGDQVIRAGYSIGYTHGVVSGHDKLREMFAVADERMYTAKHEGKNMIVGE